MKFRERVKNIFLKLVGANDTPHRIALGFAIGIFYGLFPFVGVIFTIVTAIILKANKAVALVGCFVTNTWMSFFLALPSVKLGSRLFGLDWHIVWADIRRYMSMKDINDMARLASVDIILPTIVGFLTIALIIAAISYVIGLVIVIKYKNNTRHCERTK